MKNVYGDLGQIFAQSTVAEPRLCAAMMGSSSRASAPTTSCGAPTRCGPARRSGRSRRCAGSRFPRTCRSKHGFAPLGPADGPVKRAIFGENSARLYKYKTQRAELATDRIALAKAAYEREGPGRTNLRYGFVTG